MARKDVTDPKKDGAERSNSPSVGTYNARTRRDLLAMVFGCTAAVAVSGIHASAGARPDDVFDGGMP